ncbi:SDR family oxidoreductase [Planktotalea sp.]|uniref:SDR family oxidoreductase n=1 Tax=Planktotalea sp. TaxID=2029877 RepID=UPI0032973379
MNADTYGTPRVLVLGGYGLIGSGIVAELQNGGFDPVGFGRSQRTALKVHKSLEWRFGDLRDFQVAADWSVYLEGIDFVVNAAGALQDGPEDDLQAVHVTAISALAQACAERDIGLVQVSAAGVSQDAKTSFFRTKAEGDKAVEAAGGRTWILRPGLVLAQTGYGGTALLRMLSAIPFVQPLALKDTPIQSVGLPDVARAVRACLDKTIAPNTTADLVEETAHSLGSLQKQMRDWLGFEPARLEIPLPRFLLRPVGAVADGLGRLGWRSPLRSAALLTLQDGIKGDPKTWQGLGGAPMKNLPEILAQMPARAEDRVSARMALLMPICVAALALFWFLSGIIGLARISVAAQTLIDVGWPSFLAQASVGFWALVDIALAVAILWRKTARQACIGMSAVCMIYLVSASVVTPALWLDPLGPLVKIMPAFILSLVTLALLEKR